MLLILKEDKYRIYERKDKKKPTIDADYLGNDEFFTNRFNGRNIFNESDNLAIESMFKNFPELG